MMNTQKPHQSHQSAVMDSSGGTTATMSIDSDAAVASAKKVVAAVPVHRGGGVVVPHHLPPTEAAATAADDDAIDTPTIDTTMMDTSFVTTRRRKHHNRLPLQDLVDVSKSEIGCNSNNNNNTQQQQPDRHHYEEVGQQLQQHQLEKGIGNSVGEVAVEQEQEVVDNSSGDNTNPSSISMEPTTTSSNKRPKMMTMKKDEDSGEKYQEGGEPMEDATSTDNTTTTAPPPPPPADGGEQQQPMMMATEEEEDTLTATIPPLLIEYPKDIAIPSSCVTQSLFEEEMQVLAAAAAAASGGDDTSDTSYYQNQKVLSQVGEVGILSFQKVLLPALACTEGDALKQYQSIVQRDYPQHKLLLKMIRKTMFNVIGKAMQAVQESAAKRQVMDMERERTWKEQREIAHQQKLQDEQQLEIKLRDEKMSIQKLNYLKRKRELKKRLPRNIQLYRETAFLQNEISNLHKEERMWLSAQRDLNNRETDIVQQEKDIIAAKAKAEAEASNNNNGEETSDNNNNAVAVIDNVELQTIENVLDSMTMSSYRIQRALDIVDDAVTRSDMIRKKLYKQYREEYQFAGYHGIKDPKGLLRALSQQTQTQSSQDE